MDPSQMPPEMAGAVPQNGGAQVSDLAPPSPENDPNAQSKIVDAVRQVMAEMGIGNTETPPPAPKQTTGKSRGGKVDAEDFERLQSAVAFILQQLGLVDEQAALEEAIKPIPQHEQPENDTATSTASVMGATPGKAADPGTRAQPIGPLAPGSEGAMADAGKAGRAAASRVGKLASMLGYTA